MEGRGSHSTRDTLLRAADRVVVEGGASGLTLEAVAREAGVSKGGLLYHFPNKEALVSGMIERLVGGFDDAVGRELEGGGGPRAGRWVRAYAEASFTEDRWYLEVGSGLLAAVAEYPALLEPLRRGFEEWQRRAEDNGVDPAVATIVRLAADGLFFAELLDFAPPEGELRGRVLGALLRLARKSRA